MGGTSTNSAVYITTNACCNKFALGSNIYVKKNFSKARESFVSHRFPKDKRGLAVLSKKGGREMLARRGSFSSHAIVSKFIVRGKCTLSKTKTYLFGGAILRTYVVHRGVNNGTGVNSCVRSLNKIIFCTDRNGTRVLTIRRCKGGFRSSIIKLGDCCGLRGTLRS